MTSGITFDGTRFWVRHRRREYGPFDYEWSKDFCGIEMMYRGSKFGEYCSSEEFFADLKPYKLPISVAEVSTIAMGCLVYGILNGLNERERRNLLTNRLESLGYGHFANVE